MKSKIYYIIFLFVILSCKRSANSPDYIARVGERYLTVDDIKKLVPKQSSKEDSTTIVENYIESWIGEQLLAQKAIENLEDISEIEKQVEETKNTLLIHAYETKLIAQNNDTLITEKDIQHYYLKNQNSFMLKDNIVKVNYVKLPKNSPKIEKVKKWYKSSDEKDLTELKAYALQYASNSYIDNDSWLLFDDLLKEIPIENYNSELFFKYRKDIELEDSLNVYLLHIKDFKTKNNASPISFERTNIKNIILNKRKLDLIDKLKGDLMLKAKENNSIEIKKIK